LLFGTTCQGEMSEIEIGEVDVFPSHYFWEAALLLQEMLESQNDRDMNFGFESRWNEGRSDGQR